MFLVAISAIVIPLITVVVLRMPAKIGMAISAAVVSILTLFFWQMTPIAMTASVAQGLHRSLTIGLILFGAILLLKTMQNIGYMDRLKLGLHKISSDMRVQTVIVAFAFVSLIEGISGFGTPSIIAAPLLMILVFRPLAAASLALLGDTVACTFGAVATPLLVGLENVPGYTADLAQLVGAQVTLVDLIIATILPAGLVSLLIFSFSEQSIRQKWLSLVKIIPWSLFIGLVYSTSAVIIVRLLGPEFTSVISGAISLIVATITASRGWLMPREIWRHHANEDTTDDMSSKVKQIPLWKAWLPYVVVIILLLVSRTVLVIKQFLSSAIDASWDSIFGIESISSSWAILYSPGTILIIGAIFATIISRVSLKSIANSARSATMTTLGALTALIPTLIMVQIFINSGINNSSLVSMPIYIAETLAQLFSNLWVIVAPLLGAIGAFIAGSSTVSNLTMAPIQYNIATDTGLPVLTILALQMIGAAAGNTIAIHNVVAASTVVGLPHREGLIIKRLIIPTIIYLLIAALIGFLAVIFSQ